MRGSKPKTKRGPQRKKESDPCLKPGWRRLRTPHVVNAGATGGLIRHVREFGEGNPTRITYCGLATMEEFGAVEGRGVMNKRWCGECKTALELWLIRQEIQ